VLGFCHIIVFDLTNNFEYIGFFFIHHFLKLLFSLDVAKVVWSYLPGELASGMAVCP
jgi:hypothetical protein